MLFRRSPCAVALAMGALIHCPWALADAPASAESLELVKVEDQASPFRQVYGVEVTGTAIINPKARERLPLTVIERRDIERSGATSLLELIESLPIVHSSPNDGQLGAVSGGVTSVGLRGEAKSTLVLLNGVRLPHFGIQNPVSDAASTHLALVPLSIIDRIEVLREGASTLYGSDAVAGVINIITRSQLQGFLVSSRHGLVGDGQGNQHSAEISWGVGQLGKDGYQLLASLGRVNRQRLLAPDRPTVWKPTTLINDNFATYYWPGSVYDYATRSWLPHQLYSNGQCEGEHLYAGEEVGRTPGRCYFDRTSLYDIYPKEASTSLFVQGQWILSPDHTLWVEHAANHSDRTYQLHVPSFNQMDTSTNRWHNMSALALGPVLGQYTDRFKRSTLGLRGQWLQHSYTLHVYDAEHSSREDHLNVYTTAPPGYFTTAELTTPYQELGVATIDKLRALQSSYLHLAGTNRLSGAEIRLSGEKEFDNGWVSQHAFGLGWRSESIDSTQSLRFYNIQAQRSVPHLLGEWSLALNEALTLALGARADHYSDVGQANALKLSGRYQPNSRWMLRGALGNGFRAPSQALTTVGNPLLTDLASTYNGRPVKVLYEANPDLKPERSRHLTLGMQWTPSPQWAAGVDWWSLISSDLVSTYSPSGIMADPALRSLYLREIDSRTPNSNNALGVYLLPQNLSRRDQQGIDYQFSYRKPLDKGVFRWQAVGTWNLRSKFATDAGATMLDNLGNYLTQTRRYTPRHQWHITAAYEPSSSQRHQLTLNYLSGNVERAGLPDQNRVPGHWTLDWKTHWSPARGITLGMGIDNITGRLPPQRLITLGRVQGVDTRYGDFRGRTFTLQLDAKL